MFDVYQHKCWMFPSNKMDKLNAEVAEQERINRDQKYPTSNAKEVVI